MLWFISFVELVCLVHDFIKIPMEKMNEENTKCVRSLLRCFAVELWRFISSTVLNGKLLCFRMDASVRSWIWWATMWGRDWMSWRGKRSHASGCCWRLNWTAPMHRVREVYVYVLIKWSWWARKNCSRKCLLWLQVFRWIMSSCWSSLNIWTLIIRTHLKPKTWSCLS